MKKIVITGGHHNSALAVIDELNKLGKFSYLWFGHRFSVWGDKTPSAEYQEVTARKIPFVDLKAGKLYKTKNLFKLARLPRGFINAFYHLARFRPALVLSFGGYLAPPTAIASLLLRIPVYTHEQTTVVGWSNQLIGKWAKTVFLAWEQSEKFFPRGKTIVTGLPLRKEIVALKNASAKSKRSPKRETTGKASHPFKTIYVTGGKQGSLAINKTVEKALPQLLKEFKVIHQCGGVSFLHSKEKLLAKANRLSEKLRKNYTVQEYFFANQLKTSLGRADFVISRGGAHTIYELAYLGKPAIIIPIPWASHNEQTQNARLLEKAGMAIILEEKDLDKNSLLNACRKLARNLNRYQEKGKQFSKTIKADAGKKIAQKIAQA